MIATMAIERVRLTDSERDRLHRVMRTYGIKRVARQAKVAPTTLMPAVDGLPVTPDSAERIRAYLTSLEAPSGPEVA